MNDDPLSKAIRNLGVYRLYRYKELELRLACLIRAEDLSPLRAPWWTGKEAYIIGADLSGNFFLRHCDGSIRYWNHAEQTDVILAPSIKEFVSKLEYDEEH